MGLCKTAKLTAKLAILSTSQCISAIQQNTGGRVSMFSQVAPTTLANPRMVKHPFPSIRHEMESPILRKIAV
jgi:hypothetical protein